MELSSLLLLIGATAFVQVTNGDMPPKMGGDFDAMKMGGSWNNGPPPKMGNEFEAMKMGGSWNGGPPPKQMSDFDMMKMGRSFNGPPPKHLSDFDMMKMGGSFNGMPPPKMGGSIVAFEGATNSLRQKLFDMWRNIDEIEAQLSILTNEFHVHRAHHEHMGIHSPPLGHNIQGEPKKHVVVPDCLNSH